MVHFDAYNRKFGSDGFHDPLNWVLSEDEVVKFKAEFIHKHMIETEIKENTDIIFDGFPVVELIIFDGFPVVESPRFGWASCGRDIIFDGLPVVELIIFDGLPVVELIIFDGFPVVKSPSLLMGFLW
ncbi:hypothetical protein QZH41_001085 [Actinostola sp. cb2023]|nr:hypothetical protein QZH41_001085 [Actinostola sp. cb2023]